jgi:hypothetical protein
MGFGLAFPLVLGRDFCWVKRIASSFGSLQNLHACVHIYMCIYNYTYIFKYVYIYIHPIPGTRPHPLLLF